MSLRKYLKVFDIGLQNTFVYRWNFLLRTLFGFVPLAGTVFIWRAVFAGRQGSAGHQNIAGYSYNGMIFYFLMTLLVNNLVSPSEDEWQIAAEIRDGLINAFLTKPLNYLGHRAALFVSNRFLFTAVTLLPVATVFACFRHDITLPAHALTWPLFAISIFMAAFIQFFIAYSLAMMAFWILEISTIVFILYSFEYFLSGQTFPLDIMPAWLQGLLKWLPFTYELFFPIAVFLERIRGHALYDGLLIQAVWLLATWLTARAMFRNGVAHYQAVGG